MQNKKKSKGGGIVFSTNPEYNFGEDDIKVTETVPPGKQDLRVWLDSKQRKGKVVTLITGFVGSDEALKGLEKGLKNLCGTGGSSKNGEVLLQGDFREKVVAWLINQGYKAKKAGG